MVNEATPSNTIYKSEWAVSLFKKGQNHRLHLSISENFKLSRDCLTTNINEVPDGLLNEALQHFVFEVKRKNGENYKSQLLYGAFCGIQSYLRSKGRRINLFEDEVFQDCVKALDASMKRFAALGHGPANKLPTQPITVEEENELLEKGILGDSNPTQLLHTMVYLTGLHFALRCGQEHRNLRLRVRPQIQGPYTDPTSKRLYSEGVSKTNSGGLNHRKCIPVVKAFENSADKQRCYVRLWEKYTSLCPVSSKIDVFYLTPLKKQKQDCWYMSSPVGHNTLKTTVKRLCEAGGLGGKRTNHSLRVSSATRLYDARIDEQQICEQTGHRSSAVRLYKRTNSMMQAEVSDIWYGNSKKSKSETETPPKNPIHTLSFLTKQFC